MKDPDDLNEHDQLNFFITLHRQSEKFLNNPKTDVKLGTSGRWVGTGTGAGVTSTLV